MRRVRHLIVPGLAILAIVVALFAWGVDSRTNSEAKARATAQARLAVCLQFNIDQTNQRNFQKALSRTDAQILSPPPRTAKAQRAVDAALKIDDALVDSFFQNRICTPGAIIEFYRPTAATTTTARHP